jgi:hypothetical protein
MMTKSSPAKLANIRIKRSKSMTQSLAVYEDIRKNINFIDEIQHQEVDEVLSGLVKKAQTYWAGREKRAGQSAGRRELDSYVDKNFKWLGLLMGRQNIDWTELSFGNMRSFFKSPSNRIGLDDADVDKVFAKVQKQFNIPNTNNDTKINDDALTSQAIVKGLLKQGIVQAQAKQGLEYVTPKASAPQTPTNIPIGAKLKTKRGTYEKTSHGWVNTAKPKQPVDIRMQDALAKSYLSKISKTPTPESISQVQENFAITELGIPKWLTRKKMPVAHATLGSTKTTTLKQPTSIPPQPQASTAVPAAVAKPQTTEPFTMQVDIKGQTVKVTKVEPSAKAPAGWYYWHPEYKTWVYPPKDSKDAKIFDQYYAGKTMNEATKNEINARLDHLGAARQAEKQGDKALQYEKLADYHTEFSKVKKLKTSDRVHHTTQAGIYRSAAQAVRSAQETLAKSSK